MFCFGLVWFGLVGSSFDASLGTQLWAQTKGRPSEAMLVERAPKNRIAKGQAHPFLETQAPEAEFENPTLAGVRPRRLHPGRNRPLPRHHQPFRYAPFSLLQQGLETCLAYCHSGIGVLFGEILVTWESVWRCHVLEYSVLLSPIVLTVQMTLSTR